MTGIVEITEADCPYCAEKINIKAKKCKHCGEILDSTMRELEYLKSNKKDIYVTNSASSVSNSHPMHSEVQRLTSTMANWALGTGIISLLTNVSLNADNTLTIDDATGAAILACIPVILGTIVLNTGRPGKNRARWAIILAIFSTISVFAHVN